MVEDKKNLLGNRYHIIKRLSSGASGHVYLAEDTTKEVGNNLCAVKELSPNTRDPEIHKLFCERFENEAKYLRVLNGFNGQIPKLYECFSAKDGGDKEVRYIAQEYIEGKTLRQKLEEGVLSEAQVKEVLVSLLPVIAYMHSRDFIHRDINPTNIILRSHDGSPVLIDFGAVKEVATTIVASPNEVDPLTIVIGKTGYMAPEHLSGRPVFASDLYSLGVTAVELLSGLKPGKIARDPVRGKILWHSHVPNISRDFAAVVDKAIEEYAEQRYGDAQDMLKALESVVIPESDDSLRQQLGEAFSIFLSRRPQPLAGKYTNCYDCDFYVTLRDEHCPNCGAYNVYQFSAEDLHLMRKSPAEHLKRIAPRESNSWLVVNQKFLEDDGLGIIVGVAVAGGAIIRGVRAVMSKESDTPILDAFIPSGLWGGVIGLLVGLLLSGLVWLALKAALSPHKARLRNLGSRKEQLRKKLGAETQRYRKTGHYLVQIAEEAAERIKTISEQEKRIESRLLSTQNAVEEIIGASELRKDEGNLKRALAKAEQKHKKYQVKLLEIELLRLHNRLQVGTSRESMNGVQRATAETRLRDLNKLVKQMFGILKEANMVNSDNDREWLARILRAQEILAKLLRLLMNQINDLCLKNRENEQSAPPEEFALNLDLLNAYITYEDFYKEYRALQSE